MFRFSVFLIAVLVCLGLVAFYRGWFQFSVDSQRDQKDTTATLTIHKEKIQEDVNAVKNKTSEIIKKSKETAETRTRGQVDTIGQNKLTVMTAEKQVLNVEVVPETEIRIGEKQGTLVDLRPGDSVAVVYTLEEEGRNVAKSIAVEIRKEK